MRYQGKYVSVNSDYGGGKCLTDGLFLVLCLRHQVEETVVASCSCVAEVCVHSGKCISWQWWPVRASGLSILCSSGDISASYMFLMISYPKCYLKAYHSLWTLFSSKMDNCVSCYQCYNKDTETWDFLKNS